MSDRKTQRWNCTKCKQTGHVRHEPGADVMSVVALIALDHKRTSPNCKQPVRRIKVMRSTGGGMKIVSGVPSHDSFPNMVVLDGVVHLRIGAHSPGWKLKPGEKVRFNKHGTFLVVEANKNIAFLQVTIPRKGWNPEGTRHCTVVLPRRCEVTVIRGQLHLRRVGLKEWRGIEKDAQPSHPQFALTGVGSHLPR